MQNVLGSCRFTEVIRNKFRQHHRYHKKIENIEKVGTNIIIYSVDIR